MISTVEYFGMIIKGNIRRYSECKSIVSKIIKRQRRKNIFNKTELMFVIAANLERHKLNHNCRKSVEVLGTNCKSAYIPTIKLQRGLGQFKINGVDVNIVEPGFCEPTLNLRKYPEDVFLEALESWGERLKTKTAIEDCVNGGETIRYMFMNNQSNHIDKSESYYNENEETRFLNHTMRGYLMTKDLLDYNKGDQHGSVVEENVKTPINAMSNIPIKSYYDLQMYGAWDPFKYNRKGELNYDVKKEK